MPRWRQGETKKVSSFSLSLLQVQRCSGGLVGGGAAVSAATALQQHACRCSRKLKASRPGGGMQIYSEERTEIYMFNHMPIGSTILDDHQPHHCICLLSCYIEEASLSRKILMITCAPGLWRVWHARSPPACTALFGCAHNICDMYHRLWVNPHSVYSRNEK